MLGLHGRDAAQAPCAEPQVLAGPYRCIESESKSHACMHACMMVRHRRATQGWCGPHGVTIVMWRMRVPPALCTRYAARIAHELHAAAQECTAGCQMLLYCTFDLWHPCAHFASRRLQSATGLPPTAPSASAPPLQVPMMVAEQQLKARAKRAGLAIPTWAAIPLASLSLQASWTAGRRRHARSRHACMHAACPVPRHWHAACPAAEVRPAMNCIQTTHAHALCTPSGGACIHASLVPKESVI